MQSESTGVSFFSKTPTECPVCETKFFREEMRTGRGRLIAGNLTRELRRTYEPSKKYGAVYPLIYPVVVCPSCYYSAYSQDFGNVPQETRSRLFEATQDRIETVAQILDGIDFTRPRGLKEGLAGYLLAVMCYDFFPREFGPTVKQGLSCLRAAWICNDLAAQEPKENYDKLAHLFYRKARFFYALAVEQEQNGKQSIPNSFHLGPDLDKNYGYDGILYIAGLLDWLYGPRKDKEKRRIALGRSKRTVARIFGMGRASRDKPAAILDNAREVYEEIAHELGLENVDPEQDNE
ncbi:MAG: DUF2225 domain-containing protein [Spirochaetaceae bacterium]|nr:MAG: DUF2225 domain-containing protein [Spirochaetaceae bacterium]